MRLNWQTDGAVWQWTGKQNGQTGNRQELWQAGSQALIPLVGNNSQLIIIPMQMPIFIQITWRSFSPFAQPVWLPTIYLFTLYNPNRLYSNNF